MLLLVLVLDLNGSGSMIVGNMDLSDVFDVNGLGAWSSIKIVHVLASAALGIFFN